MNIILSLVMLCLFVPTAEAKIPKDKALRVIIGESSNQGYEGMLAVAEVLRRREAQKRPLRGFYGLNSPHVDKQPQWVWKQAEKAWEASKTSNITLGATHFENIKAFGVPSWAKDQKPVVIIGDHAFYKLKS